jgi:hypothetical protein
MALEDDISNIWGSKPSTGSTLKSGLGTPTNNLPPVQSPSTVAPDVEKAIQGGTSLNQTPPAPAQAPAQAAAPASQQPQQQSPMSPPPLSLHGNTPETQAKMLTDYLKSQGVQVSNFVVGGNSPYDSQINKLIDEINNPQTTPEQRKQAAANIGGLLPLRNKTFAKESGQPGRESVYQGEPFGFDSKTNAVGTAPGLPGGNTIADLISALASGKSRPSSSERQIGGGETGGSARDRLLSELSKGGIDPARRAIAEAKIVDQSEGAASGRKKQLASNLSNNGIFGGAADDALAGFDRGVIGDRTNAQRDLELGLMDDEIGNKKFALSSLLQEQGLDQVLASLDAQQKNNQISQAMNYEFGNRGYDLTESSQDWNKIATLLELAASGEEGALQRAMALMGYSTTEGVA